MYQMIKFSDLLESKLQEVVFNYSKRFAILPQKFQMFAGYFRSFLSSTCAIGTLYYPQLSKFIVCFVTVMCCQVFVRKILGPTVRDKVEMATAVSMETSFLLRNESMYPSSTQQDQSTTMSQVSDIVCQEKDSDIDDIDNDNNQEESVQITEIESVKNDNEIAKRKSRKHIKQKRLAKYHGK